MFQATSPSPKTLGKMLIYLGLGMLLFSIIACATFRSPNEPAPTRIPTPTPMIDPTPPWVSPFGA